MSESKNKPFLLFLKDLVREHPFIIIFIALLTITVAVWNIIMGYHNLIIENKNATIGLNSSIVQNKDATIETLRAALERSNGTIKNIEERLNAKDEQILAKDKQVSEYRNRAMVIKASQTTYSNYTNSNLRQKTLLLISSIRDILLKYRNEQDRIRDTYSQKSATRKEMEASWQEYSSEQNRISTELMNKYNREYKINAILFKDELLSRLPKNKIKREDYIESNYEYPTNPLGISSVVDDLEKLARSLNAE